MGKYIRSKLFMDKIIELLTVPKSSLSIIT